MGLPAQTLSLFQAARQLLVALPADAVLLLPEHDLDWNELHDHLGECKILVATQDLALREKTKEIGGIVDADTTLKLDKPELRVHINRDRAADLGVDTSNISTALRLMVGGDDQVSRFRDPSVNEDYDVQLRLTEQDRKDTATISRLFVPSSRGGLVRLDSLVDIKEDISPSRIDRLDRQRQASMRAGVAPGFALAA